MSQQYQIRNCIRCAKRCRAVAKKNPDAQVFVKGTVETGRLCADCLVVDFFKNFDLGILSSLGPDFVERFDPEGLRLPHIQEQFTAIIMAARKQYGAELTPEEIDWDEVIANWHLPFPEKPKRGRRKG